MTITPPSSRRLTRLDAVHATMRRSEPIVLYEADCALCSAAVRFLIRRDRARRLRFAPLGGTTAAGLLARHPALAGMDTMIFVDGARARVRSDAALAACATLGGGWSALARLARLVPRGVRDAVYALVARSRHRAAAGAACPVIPAAWRDRFLD